MPLNLNNGNFIPHIRYMASTSSWTLSTDDGQQPFTFTKAIVNLATIETGWGYFSEGVAPEWVMDPSLETKAPRPDGQDWKRGFRVNVYSKQMFGDEPNREFATTATGAVKGIEALYAQYEQQAPQNPGKVPVVEFAGAVPTRIGKGNTNIPTLKIIKWADKPADLKVPENVATVSPVVAAQPTTTQAEPFGDEEFV